MNLSWALEGKGAGSAETRTVDEAAEALSAAVRACYAEDGPSVQAHVLWTVVAPLRAVLVTDGRFAVERGQSWSHSLGGLFVALSPS